MGIRMSRAGVLSLGACLFISCCGVFNSQLVRHRGKLSITDQLRPPLLNKTRGAAAQTVSGTFEYHRDAGRVRREELSAI